MLMGFSAEQNHCVMRGLEPGIHVFFSAKA
jgi:hypothetical protein